MTSVFKIQNLLTLLFTLPGPFMKNEVIFFISFIIIILILMFFDLGMFRRKGYHTVSVKESLSWTSFWVVLSLLFFLLVRYKGNLIHGIDNFDDLRANISRYHEHLSISGLSFQEALALYNRDLSLQYLTGYLIEYSLSMDNVFVILLIFISFNVPGKYYKRVLFWGILGAIVMRFLFIFILSAVIYRAGWVLFLFGGLLIYTAVTMARDFFKQKVKRIDVEHHPVVRFARRIFPVHPRFEEHKFWLRTGTGWYITPLFIVLLVVEFSDVVFAVDSVPAIFAVTRDPYIVFFSNVFAIMGLRSLFFLLSHFFNRFYFLNLGLSLLLAFIGVKMLIPLLIRGWKLDTEISLGIILGILTLSIVASLLRKSRNAPAKG
jgi:tellurite resistance protein TerC